MRRHLAARALACGLLVAGVLTTPPGLAGQAATRPAGARAPGIDAEQLRTHVRVLADDSMGGRRTGSEGNERARRYIERVFAAIGASPIGASFVHPFTFESRSGTVRGVNVVARIAGSERPDRVIVITAHYDHLGERNGQIFNGADDNASGVAAMLALAHVFAASPPRHTIVFAALDAEESGLRGAHAFVQDPPLPLASIALNINLDMVGRNDAGELWVAGTHHTPALRPTVERLAADVPVRLRIGHDRPGVPGQDDWTGSSDHGAFHARGIPFLYFGVEDHADYHKESDEFAGIDPDFQLRAARTIAAIVIALDGGLEVILPRR